MNDMKMKIVFAKIGAAVGPLIAGPVSNFGWENVFYMLMVADVIALVVNHFKVDFNPFVANKFLVSFSAVGSFGQARDSAIPRATARIALQTRADRVIRRAQPILEQFCCSLLHAFVSLVSIFFLPIFCLWLLRAAARTIDRFPFFVIFLPS